MPSGPILANKSASSSRGQFITSAAPAPAPDSGVLSLACLPFQVIVQEPSPRPLGLQRRACVASATVCQNSYPPHRPAKKILRLRPALMASRAAARPPSTLSRPCLNSRDNLTGGWCISTTPCRRYSHADVGYEVTERGEGSEGKHIPVTRTSEQDAGHPTKACYSPIGPIANSTHTAHTAPSRVCGFVNFVGGLF
jgi:hypothetical protein